MKVLLVLGTLRSGKTLLARALSVHSKIQIVKEPFFFYFKICRNIFYKTYFPENYDPQAPMETDFLKSRNMKKSFSDNLAELMFDQTDIDELITYTKKQQAAEPGERGPKVINFLKELKPAKAKDVFRQLMLILSSAYGEDTTQIIGFSEAWCEEFITPMLESFEMDINCILTLRDPRAVFASRNRSKKMISEYGGTYPILFLAQNWRKSIAYYYANQKKDNFLGVKYESIVSDPEKSFRMICAFIGVEFDSKVMDTNLYKRGDQKPWEQNTNYKQSKGLSKESIDKWKDVMSSKDIRCIEYLCSCEMNLLAYQKMNQEQSLVDLSEYDDGVEEHVGWIKKFNYQIDASNIEVESKRFELSKQLDGGDQSELERFFLTNEFLKALRESLHG